MKNNTLLKNTLTSLLFVMAFALAAQGQATRTWVSGVGDDVNPCSRTAPCKTFAGAISKTAKNGEIDALDPGGFGTITITKSITIDGRGTNASILASLAPQGVLINITDPADVNKTVTLRNLTINGTTSGTNGIRILAAKNVIIENCVIFGFTGSGISDARSTTGGVTLFVSDTNITNNTTAGIKLAPGAGVFLNAVLDSVRMESNATNGLHVSSGTNTTIRNSVISGNASNGVLADELLAGATTLNLESCLVTSNGTGVANGGGSPAIFLSNVTVSGNTTGLAGAGMTSYVNNKLQGNSGGNGMPAGSATQAQQ